MSEPDFQSEIARRRQMEKVARRILGVSETADAAEIRRTYFALALQNHPDKKPGDKEAERRFKNIVNAYEFLIKGKHGGIKLEDKESKQDGMLGQFGENEWGYWLWWQSMYGDESKD